MLPILVSHHHLCYPQRYTRQECDQCNNANKSDTLDDTYARILCNIPEKRSIHALKILQWLAYSARPLQIEEIGVDGIIHLPKRGRHSHAGR